VIYQPVQENFQHLLAAPAGPVRQAHVRELARWCQRTFTAQRADFVARKRHGFVRECHGDMHLGNMILQDDAVVIFDCIEFNDTFRWIDVASDVAFLIMDLADRQRPDLAHRFLNGYVEATGDYDLLRLVPFYCTYRAMVRAKVAAIRLGQGVLQAEEAAQVQEACASYVDLATRYTRPSPPRLLLTHGVSGSGKTYYTGRLLEATGAIRVRSDVERKRLFGIAPLARSTAHDGVDLYTPEATERTYAQLARQARRIVRAGYTAIVDATFLQRVHRQTFRRLAAQLDVPCLIVDFSAPVETLRRRVAQRSRRGNDASEADLAVLEAQLAARQPLLADEQACTLTLATESPEAFERLLQSVL
jgi:predicted kinase